MNDVVKLYERLNKLKTKKAELEGQYKAVLKRLKDDYGLKSEKDLAKRIEELKKEIEDKNVRKLKLIERADRLLRNMEDKLSKL